MLQHPFVTENVRLLIEWVSTIDSLGHWYIHPWQDIHRGEYLARGGYTSVPENQLWTPTRLVIVRFPSRKDVEAFLDSEEYAPIKALRNKYADCTLTIIDGV